VAKLLGWSIVALIVLMLIILMIPEVRALPFKPFDDRPQLDSGLRTTITLVDATAAEVGQGRTVTVMQQNGQSRSDQGDLSAGIGYDHCDDWKAWFFPGWSSWKIYEIVVADDRDREALKADVGAYWEGLGYSVTTFTNHDGLFMDFGHTQLSLSFSEFSDVAHLFGGTDCLPDD
jgi:hypothetical protein